MVSLYYTNGIAQQPVKNTTPVESYAVSQDSIRLNKLDSVTKNISIQLMNLEGKATAIHETVNTINHNTDDSILVEGAKSFVFTFVYELLGYKSGSSTGWFSKIVSGLSLIFLLIRIYFFFKKKEKEHPKFTKALNIYLICLVLFAVLLPWTAAFFPNKEMDKEQIIRVTENAKKLNREIEKIQSASFTKLVKDIQELQKFSVDTIQPGNKNGTKTFDIKFNRIQNQLFLANKKLDSLGSTLTIHKNNQIAIRERQAFLSWLIVPTFIMVLIFFIFFISKKPWTD